MKRLLSVFVLSMFLMSTGLVYAADTPTTGDGVSATAKSENKGHAPKKSVKKTKKTKKQRVKKRKKKKSKKEGTQ